MQILCRPISERQGHPQKNTVDYPTDVKKYLLTPQTVPKYLANSMSSSQLEEYVNTKNAETLNYLSKHKDVEKLRTDKEFSFMAPNFSPSSLSDGEEHKFTQVEYEEYICITNLLIETCFIIALKFDVINRSEFNQGDYDSNFMFRGKKQDFDTKNFNSFHRDFSNKTIHIIQRDFDTKNYDENQRDFDTKNYDENQRDFDTKIYDKNQRDFDTKIYCDNQQDFDTESFDENQRDFDTEILNQRDFATDILDRTPHNTDYIDGLDFDFIIGTFSDISNYDKNKLTKLIGLVENFNKNKCKKLSSISLNYSDNLCSTPNLQNKSARKSAFKRSMNKSMDSVTPSKIKLVNKQPWSPIIDSRCEYYSNYSRKIVLLKKYLSQFNMIFVRLLTGLGCIQNIKHQINKIKDFVLNFSSNSNISGSGMLSRATTDQISKFSPIKLLNYIIHLQTNQKNKRSKFEQSLLMGLFFNLNYFKNSHQEPLIISTEKQESFYRILLLTSVGSVDIKSRSSVKVDFGLLRDLVNNLTIINHSPKTYLSTKGKLPIKQRNGVFLNFHQQNLSDKKSSLKIALLNFNFYYPVLLKLCDSFIKNKLLLHGSIVNSENIEPGVELSSELIDYEDIMDIDGLKSHINDYSGFYNFYKEIPITNLEATNKRNVINSLIDLKLSLKKIELNKGQVYEIVKSWLVEDTLYLVETINKSFLVGSSTYYVFSTVDSDHGNDRFCSTSFFSSSSSSDLLDLLLRKNLWGSVDSQALQKPAALHLKQQSPVKLVDQSRNFLGGQYSGEHQADFGCIKHLCQNAESPLLSQLYLKGHSLVKSDHFALQHLNLIDESIIEKGRSNAQFYSKWLNGSKIDIIRHKPNYVIPSDNLNTEHTVEHKLNIFYLNLPCQKVRNDKKILIKLTNYFYEVDIFLISEAYMDMDQIIIPNGYSYTTHTENKQKSSFILWKTIFDQYIEVRTYGGNISSIKLKIGKLKIGLSSFYRSPTDLAEMYSTSEYKNSHEYIHWVFKKITKILNNNNKELIVGDLNANLHDFNDQTKRKYENLLRSLLSVLSEATIKDLFKDHITYHNYLGHGKTIDVAFTNMTHHPIKMTSVEREETIQFSDHTIFDFSLKYSSINDSSLIQSKTKIKDNRRGRTISKLINQELNFEFPSELTSPEECIEFIDHTVEISKKMLPMKIIHTKTNQELLKFDPHVKKLLKDRSNYMKLLDLKSPKVMNFGLTYYNKLINKEMVRARRRFWSIKLNTMNSNRDSLWELYKKFNGKKNQLSEFCQ